VTKLNRKRISSFFKYHNWRWYNGLFVILANILDIITKVPTEQLWPVAMIVTMNIMNSIK